MNKRTIVGTLALFMFLLIMAQTVTAQQPSAKDLLKEGDNYFKQGDYGRAVKSYESILNLYPKAKEANDAKKKLEQAQTKARITTPVTEANFEYEQNSTGSITITGYKNEIAGGIRDLVIPAQIRGIDVTIIDRYAFRVEKRITYSLGGSSSDGSENYEVFESVTIPSTVKAIGDYAFSGRSIKKLILSEGLLFLRNGVFADNKLTSVTLPASITEIRESAFEGNQLTSIDFPADLKVIGDAAFGGNKLTKVTIPAGITTIGDFAFAGNQLTEVTIPENVTTIGCYAFANNMISTLTFSDSSKVRTIGEGAFSINRLRSVVLPASFTETRKRQYSANNNFQTQKNVFSGSSHEIFKNNPLGYIKISSSLKDGNDITNRIVPAVEWEQPKGSLEGTVALKIGANINTRGLNLDQGFINYYTSQGNKAGIYMRRGQLWVTATQEEFDAFIAEVTK